MNDPSRMLYKCTVCHALPCECSRVHEPLTLVSVRCSVCKEAFLNETAMSNHRIAHHEQALEGAALARSNGRLEKA